MIAEVSNDASCGTMRVNFGARGHCVSRKINQNIQVGLGNAPGGGKIVQFADVCKAIGMFAKRIRHRIVFAARAR